MHANSAIYSNLPFISFLLFGAVSIPSWFKHRKSSEYSTRFSKVSRPDEPEHKHAQTLINREALQSVRKILTQLQVRHVLKLR
mmetsp:Transcript_3813/g.6674  ORF Transcript_3813/g.6674 Transcript_3813/m.6674 type:complete len:83 (-) Transcript_3813:2654-2902(-)